MKYPYKILLIWWCLWIIAALVIFIILNSQAKDGFILRQDCVKEKDDICLLFSSPYKVEFHEEFMIQTIGAGILIGAVVIIIGYGREMIVTTKNPKK